MEIVKALWAALTSIERKGLLILAIGTIIGYAIAHALPLGLATADEYFFKSRVELLRAELDIANKKAKDAEDALANEKKSQRADMDDINKKVKNAEDTLANEQKARALEVEKLKSEYASLLSAYSAASREANDLKKAAEKQDNNTENSAPRRFIKALEKDKHLPCNGESMLGNLVVSTAISERIDKLLFVSVYLKDHRRSIEFFSNEEPIERIFDVPIRFNVQHTKAACSIRVRVAE